MHLGSTVFDILAGAAGTLAPADASVHEICSRDEQIYFQVCFSKTQPGLPSGGKPLAALQMVLQPDAQCKSSRFGNSKTVKVKLCGHCTVHFEAAQETYTVELPSIFIKDMQTPLKTCGLSGALLLLFAGCLSTETPQTFDIHSRP